MTKMRTKAAGAGVAVLLGMGGVVAVATSSGAQDTTTTGPAPVEAPPAEGAEDHDGCDWFDEDLSEEELAELQGELQAEADALIAALDAAGVQYELSEDELGVSFPEPVGDDPEDWEAFEDALMQLWAEEFAALPGDEQAEIVEMESAYAEEFRTALDEAGIAYELETDPVTGVEFPVFDEDDEAAWEALEDLEELDLFEDELDDDDRFEDDDDDLDHDDDLDDEEDVDDEPEQTEAA